MKSLISPKLAYLLLVLLALLFGLGQIQDIVQDRQQHRKRAVAGMGTPQIVTGPMVHLRCVERWRDTTNLDAGHPQTVEREKDVSRLVPPESLMARAGADVQNLHRSLHKVSTYNMKLALHARWTPESLKIRPQNERTRISCATPELILPISDPTGIRSAGLSWNGLALPLRAGTHHSRYNRGLHAVLPESVGQSPDDLEAVLDLELFGIEDWTFVPAGDMTQLSVQSNWQHPSFGGQFLPAERAVGAEGFKANWRISSLAIGNGDDLQKGQPVCARVSEGDWEESKDCLKAIRVSFVDPVNAYTLSDRASKYGLLFVVLTFVAVGLFEVMQRLRVHPVQYFLVGSAVAIFFLLLLSLGEHLAFNLAYAIAATACVLLLTYYAVHILHGVRRGLPFGLGVGVLYGLLFLLLQLEQKALVVGSLALFAVLAAVMYLTRKVDWYRLLTPAGRAEAAQA
ncbi:MAG: cell envelope integrity protein CreD [Hylemonella sp.]|uniref:cell envelope integrity protein CreD n=1 Tax=Hylemonella sp. TaxID=2066020 RepID=UPI0022CC010E|nr:cell envelope integrity protein CreD [Hylemonella sp.]MCZ8251107.1 cell envelope integrity protein CreD [Hylemonella sp.]